MFTGADPIQQRCGVLKLSGLVDHLLDVHGEFDALGPVDDHRTAGRYWWPIGLLAIAPDGSLVLIEQKRGYSPR